MEGERSDACFCAFSTAATAFFEYIALSISALGWSLRYAEKSAIALSELPRLESQTPR